MVARKFDAILRSFAEAEVEFLVVGGLAAVLNGVPVNTYDIDLVHSRDAENLARILPVLAHLGAPTSRLDSSERLNLMTRYGPLDLLGTIGRGLTFEDLLPHTVELKIADGVSVKVLDLPTLIALKEELTDDKDRAMLPILRRTLEETRRR